MFSLYAALKKKVSPTSKYSKTRPHTVFPSLRKCICLRPLLLPAGHICVNKQNRLSRTACVPALMSGCCLATLKLSVIGDV